MFQHEELWKCSAKKGSYEVLSQLSVWKSYPSTHIALLINYVLSIAILSWVFHVLWWVNSAGPVLIISIQCSFIYNTSFIIILCIGQVCCFILAVFYISLLNWLNLDAPAAFKLHTYRHSDTHAKYQWHNWWLYQKALASMPHNFITQYNACQHLKAFVHALICRAQQRMN